MKRLLASLLLMTILISNISFAGEKPVVNLPYKLRQENWIGNRGQGSCVHASMVMLLRWQHQDRLANYWRSHYQNGETWDGLVQKMEANNVRWAGTYNQENVKFLEWAIRTRRGCMVTCQDAAHMVVLVHLDKDWAGILDNNSTNRIIWKTRKSFLKEWYSSNSWAVTPVYTVPPPKFRRIR